MKELAQALRQVYTRPMANDERQRGAQSSIFMRVFDIVDGSDILAQETLGRNYYMEIERQAREILSVFQSENGASRNLIAIKDVVEFFYATYLSRNPLEAISKLTKLHLQQTNL